MGGGNSQVVLVMMAAVLMGCSIHRPTYADILLDNYPPQTPSDTMSWCVANPAADPKLLQEALDFFCYFDPDFCKPFQPDQPCYEPNNVVAHASFAFNSFWQDLRRTYLTVPCDFGGLALVAVTNPSN
ncbi:hypothetical protein GOP47_0011371 [Adiantum capillus-veneris]|uniref:X8 domain-containing protein n=1 Tax=Adiantum capillus-veneris TaxID=13818 RepID=A0A9D4ZFC2_ADICA|nr:hypothetical protein GOP47_0011371 [Adiantum capillus-veneris]